MQEVAGTDPSAHSTVAVVKPRRLPEIGSGLGRAIRGFKEGVSGKDAIDVTPKKEEVTEGKEP